MKERHLFSHKLINYNYYSLDIVTWYPKPALEWTPVQLAHADILLAPEEEGDDEIESSYKGLKDVVPYSKTWMNNSLESSEIKILAVKSNKEMKSLLQSDTTAFPSPSKVNASDKLIKRQASGAETQTSVFAHRSRRDRC